MNKRPLIALTGVLFTALAIIGTLVAPSAPDFVAATDEVTAYYNDESSGILASNVIYVLSGAAFLFFLGYLVSVARGHDGQGGLANTMLAGGAAGVSAAMVASGTQVVTALRVEDTAPVDPAAATALFDVSNALYGLVAPVAMAALVIATAVLCFRTGLFATWFGVASVLLGIAMLVPPIAWLGIIVFNFWVLAAAVMLYVREPAPVAGASAITASPAV